MNDTHPLIARILADMSPHVPRSPFTEEQAQEIDAAMHQDKLRDGYAQRQQAQAMRLQLNDKTGFFF